MTQLNRTARLPGMTFIVLNPSARGNPSTKFRVVAAKDWAAFKNGAAKSYAFTEFSTYPEAVEARDKANGVDTAQQDS